MPNGAIMMPCFQVQDVAGHDPWRVSGRSGDLAVNWRRREGQVRPGDAAAELVTEAKGRTAVPGELLGRGGKRTGSQGSKCQDPERWEEWEDFLAEATPAAGLPEPAVCDAYVIAFARTVLRCRDLPEVWLRFPAIICNIAVSVVETGAGFELWTQLIDQKGCSMDRDYLFETLWKDGRSSILFDEARRLALSLFDPNVPGRLIVPFFTDHGPSHFQKVAAILNKIIFPVPPESLDSRAFCPTPEEAMYLLAATWLHDIGMIYGIFDDERSKAPDIDWELYRGEHERRSTRYIQEKWYNECSWSREEKLFLSQICLHHRKRYPLGQMEPTEFDGRLGPVRLRELAALLRIADACHIDETRVPVDMKNRFQAIGFPVDAKEHWGLPMLIHDIPFDHLGKSISLHCYIPREKRYGTVTIDFHPVVDRLVESIEEELGTVVPYLTNYGNTGYKSVKAIVEHPVLDADKYLYEMWPCMLSAVSSASAVASVVGAILLATVKQAGNVPHHEIRDILKKALDVHRYNVLVHRLNEDMEGFLERGTNVSEVQQYLEAYGSRTLEACDAVAGLAKDLIQDEDVLVTYGYSNAVMTALTAQPRTHKALILLVKCYRMEPGVSVRDENVRVEKELQRAGLGYQVVEMASLNEVFASLNRQGKRVKVLLGTRGVLGNGDVLSTVGHSQIALAARDAQVEVLVVGEPAKFAEDDALNELIESHLTSQSDWLASWKIQDASLQILVSFLSRTYLKKDLL